MKDREILRYQGLVIYNSAVGGGRIQNNMTKILNPPLRAKENIDPPTFNVKGLA